MEIKGNGLLQHHFWGTYCATMCVEFNSPEDAVLVLLVFGDTWEQDKKAKNCIVFHGSDPELEIEINKLVGFGADKNKICSLAKSIDYGEEFTVKVNVPNPDQIELF